jgi:hypothetical protein
MRNAVFILALLVGLAVLVGPLLPPPEVPAPATPASRSATTEAVAPSPGEDDFRAAVARVDAAFRAEWSAAGLRPAEPAPPETVLRRLHLAMVGTVPSLAEIRDFEADARPTPDRIADRVWRLLADRRFHDNLAERLARAYVGTENGPFILFRRRRFVSWLSDQVRENTAYDHLVRTMIASDGVWTDNPAVNFLTVAIEADTDKNPDPEKLAARVSRTFLGVRMDCARCHDHPFAQWKQDDFHGIAAFFGRTKRAGLPGILDAATGDYQRDDGKGGRVKVAPAVPYAADLLPPEGHGRLRSRLAEWVTHRGNRAFARAAANRVWAVMFGRPLVEPIDDIPTDPSAKVPAALDVLADDFSGHGFDLHRLVRLIAACGVFRLDSRADFEMTAAHEAKWAVFPETRLRPDQVAAGIIQASSPTTIDAESHVVRKLIRAFQAGDFVKRYGDLGEHEFDPRGTTIPQQLLLMNGDVVAERTADQIINAPFQIARLAPDDAKAVEAAYLAVLTRRPTAEESAHFAARLHGSKGAERGRRVADLFWTLINSTEFSWNH